MNIDKVVGWESRKKIMAIVAGDTLPFLHKFRWDRPGENRISFLNGPHYPQFWKEIAVVLNKTLKENK
jgi:hypothetical protein